MKKLEKKIKEVIKQEIEEQERKKIVSFYVSIHGLHSFDHFNNMSLSNLRDRIRIDSYADCITGDF